jgi:hypothetical protein
MKIPQDPEMVQGLAQFIMLAVGRVFMIAVIIALVSLWALTEPFYELSRWIARDGKLKLKQIKN